MATAKERLNENSLSAQRPIAGQSLTNDPETPLPFEKAARFSNIHEASQFIWMRLIEPEIYTKTMLSLSKGTPIMDIAQLICRGGFQEGLWNPDLMLLLLEPTMYMLIALAERLDIELVIYTGELSDRHDKEILLGSEVEEEQARKLKRAADTGVIPEGIITAEMQEQLEEADLPETEESLLAPPKTEGMEEMPQEENQDSLLAPTT